MAKENTYFDLLIQGTDINIVSTHSCVYCGDEFAFTDMEQEMYDKHEFCYPNRCPSCNAKILLSFLNDKHLYRISDNFTKKEIISLYSSEYTGKVIDAVDYRDRVLDDFGMEFGKDIAEDIFADFLNLREEIPKPSRLIYPGIENSDYTSHAGWVKNVYLSYCVFTDCESVYYSLFVVQFSKNVFHSYGIHNGVNIFYCLNTMDSHNIFYGQDIVNCSDILLCKNMNNCQNCILSCNQVNQKYIIFNKKYTKQEYEILKDKIYKKINSPEGFEQIQKEYNNFLEQNFIEKTTTTSNCEKVHGECAANSKNCINVHKVAQSENNVNLHNSGLDTKNYFNSVEAGYRSENCIGSCTVGMKIYNIFFCYGVVESSKNIYYSWDMQNCEECMFCVGLRSKKYCILNTQYSKEQYFKKKQEIIQDLKQKKQWGKALDWNLSPFPYNDTLAYDYRKVHTVIDVSGKRTLIDQNAIGIVQLHGDNFITDATLDLGGEKKISIKWRTRDKEINVPENMKTMSASDIPTIGKVSDDILEKAIICQESGRPYRIIQQELEFCRKYLLPLPKIHHELRVDTLISQRPFGQLFLSTCDKCQKDCLSVHKSKPQHCKGVYCEECYRDYIFK